MRGEIVTPGAVYARTWVSLTTLLCRELFSLNMFGLLFTPGEVYASMLNDLVISRGEEEIEKPDLTVVFYSDIAASYLPVYANQTWTFAHAHLMFWSSVNSEPLYQ